jgi:hypothetical protein
MKWHRRGVLLAVLLCTAHVAAEDRAPEVIGGRPAAASAELQHPPRRRESMANSISLASLV